jgi:putative heme-binding domain-containing protein
MEKSRRSFSGACALMTTHNTVGGWQYPQCPMKSLTLVTVFAASVVLIGVRSEAAESQAKPLTKEGILKGIKSPEEFGVSVFAMPPEVGYPTSISAGADGAVYVAIDENGSIDAKPNRGRVVRCVDTDSDGAADRFTTFAKMDSPRGVWFDAATSTCYVLHPPFLTAYRDTDKDGVADQSDTLVKGLGFDLKFRGADHTTNGFRVGIDGWVYIAMGDYGATDAVGKDGTHLRHWGGGVMRVRLDGSGLEVYSTGQRNIYDVAVSPMLDCFTRDNTNDGGGWDVRLSHVPPTANMGYPRLFKNFSEEMVKPLADYGGGSPCGALWLGEPGQKNGPYTVEWGRNGVFYHPLEVSGAGFKAKQEKFVELPRPTDMDVDGAGNIYVSSWINATFTYAGPNVGYVARLRRKDQKPTAFPNLKSADVAQLVSWLSGDSAFLRQSAQREVLQRKLTAEDHLRLERMAEGTTSIPVAVALIQTIRQCDPRSDARLLSVLGKREDLREQILRALTDRMGNANAPIDVLTGSLTHADPRVRLVAAWGLGRQNARSAAGQIVPLLADSDPLVAHVAGNALVALEAAEPCLSVVDSSNPTLAPGAIRVLQRLHDIKVVEGLIAKLGTIQDPGIRVQIYRGLCRLHFKEAEWDGRWWGTRPDTSGPYYKAAEWAGTAKVNAALRAALSTEKPQVLRDVLIALQKNKIDLPELGPMLGKLAKEDPEFKAALLESLSARTSFTDAQSAIIKSIATGEHEPPADRAKAIRILLQRASGGGRGRGTGALDAVIEALSSIAPGSAKELSDVYNEFARETRHAQFVSYFTKLAASEDAGRKQLAYAVLTSLATSKLAKPESRSAAQRAIDQAWSNPAQSPALLAAVERTRNDAFALQVSSLTKDKNSQVAQAAASAAKALKVSGSATGNSNRPLVESMPFEKVVAQATKETGDAGRGGQLFNSLGCVACHTTSSEEPPKGPFLGGIATRYSRAELCESILKPSAKIAQGFETQWFKTGDDDEVEGFVTKESANEIEIRNIAGISTTLPKGEIKQRGKRESSVMPQGLADKITPQDLASLLVYLESLKSKSN